jgi:hypothetical protein
VSVLILFLIYLCLFISIKRLLVIIHDIKQVFECHLSKTTINVLLDSFGIIFAVIRISDHYSSL